jgi:hypothetical protein
MVWVREETWAFSLVGGERRGESAMTGKGGNFDKRC